MLGDNALQKLDRQFHRALKLNQTLNLGRATTAAAMSTLLPGESVRAATALAKFTG